MTQATHEHKSRIMTKLGARRRFRGCSHEFRPFGNPIHSRYRVRDRMMRSRIGRCLIGFYSLAALNALAPVSPAAAQTGHEWTEFAPAFCRSEYYGSLTPKQMSICDEAAFRQLSRNWQTITAANGQAYEIALDTVGRNLPANVDPPAVLRAATVVVYISEGDVFKPENVVHFYFDCHDQFQTFQSRLVPGRLRSASLGSR